MQFGVILICLFSMLFFFFCFCFFCSFLFFFIYRQHYSLFPSEPVAASSTHEPLLNSLPFPSSSPADVQVDRYPERGRGRERKSLASLHFSLLTADGGDECVCVCECMCACVCVCGVALTSYCILHIAHIKHAYSKWTKQCRLGLPASLPL